ncbi:hypothetical protein L596_026001 [Steinernema carpocapsae]|uniref:Uncharacterized protein n=1 Tax=Steinernema carpocapsae TaxID=34508 RepID=A0A4U5M044_STECR|nr:hypothetical protein L596_026001 [Steinernema carpocapsae]
MSKYTKNRRKLILLKRAPNQQHAINFVQNNTNFGRSWVHSTCNEFPITPSPNAPKSTPARPRNKRLSMSALKRPIRRPHAFAAKLAFRLTTGFHLFLRAFVIFQN